MKTVISVREYNRKQEQKYQQRVKDFRDGKTNVFPYRPMFGFHLPGSTTERKRGFVVIDENRHCESFFLTKSELLNALNNPS